MARWTSVAAGMLAVGGIAVGGAWAFRPSAKAQAAQTKPSADQKPVDPFRFMNDKERYKDASYVEIGNMRPLVKDERGVRSQSRVAVLYKDGTAKLWGLIKKTPSLRRCDMMERSGT